MRDNAARPVKADAWSQRAGRVSLETDRDMARKGNRELKKPKQIKEKAIQAGSIAELASKTAQASGKRK